MKRSISRMLGCLKYKADETKNKKKEGLEDAQKVLQAGFLFSLILSFSIPGFVCSLSCCEAYKQITDEQRPDFIMKYQTLGLKNISWIGSFSHTVEQEETHEDESQAGTYTVPLGLILFVMSFFNVKIFAAGARSWSSMASA